MKKKLQTKKQREIKNEESEKSQKDVIKSDSEKIDVKYRSYTLRRRLGIRK